MYAKYMLDTKKEKGNKFKLSGNNLTLYSVAVAV